MKSETKTVNIPFEIEVVTCEEGGYLGYLKDYPGVCTQAENYEELVENLTDALNAMLSFHLRGGLRKR